MAEKQQLHQQTALQHAGAKHRLGSGLLGAIEQAVTYQTEALTDAPVYARLSNTRNHFELHDMLAQLHGAPEALAFGSGMAALSTVALTLLQPGDHLLLQENGYGGTFLLATKLLKHLKIDYTFAPLEKWAVEIRPNTKMMLFESISNPFCRPHDIGLAVDLAKRAKAILVCDNTFASPYNCRPLEHGVDLVVESATKYLNGHSDVICGMVAGRRELMDPISSHAKILGGFLATHQCALLMRGLRSFAVRMAAHNEHGKAFAAAMREASDVVAEVYQGVSGAAARYFPLGFGGMCTVRFKTTVDVPKLIRSFTFIRDVPSLAGTETTATMPYYTTNFFMTPEEKTHLGIDKSLVRFSIGLENPQDIVQDVLSHARAAKH